MKPQLPVTKSRYEGVSSRIQVELSRLLSIHALLTEIHAEVRNVAYSYQFQIARQRAIILKLSLLYLFSPKTKSGQYG
jgi:hypothetical protein